MSKVLKMDVTILHHKKGENTSVQILCCAIQLMFCSILNT